MMYTPKYLQPKNKAIDATEDNIFTWESKGELQTDYQLKIYDLTNTLIHDSTKITSGVSSYTLPADTLTNDGKYKWTVESFGASGSAVSDYVFLMTNSTPVVSLTVAATLDVQSLDITATYSQAEDISIKQYKFILYDASDNILDDTGWLYDYLLTYTLDGLISGNTYKVECIAVAQNDLTGTSGQQSFTVAYTKPDATRTIVVTPQNDDGSILIEWDTLKQVTPVVTGTSSYVEGKFDQGLQLDDASYITYSEEIEEYFSICWYEKYALDFTGVILELDDDFTVGFESGKFYVINQSVRFESLEVDLYTFEDFGELTWEDISDETTTWLDPILPDTDLNDFLFFELTFENLIVKRNDRIIAYIEMEV